MECKVCGWWERICHCKELELFNTTKDRLYNFTDNNTFKQPVEIHGKDHWKGLLKQHGLTDDVDIKKPSELKTPFDNWKPTDRKFVKNEIIRELREKGLYNKLLKRRR